MEDAIYSLCAGIVIVLVIALIAFVVPSLNTDATGAEAFDLFLLVTMLTSLVHSRYTRKKPGGIG